MNSVCVWPSRTTRTRTAADPPLTLTLTEHESRPPGGPGCQQRLGEEDARAADRELTYRRGFKWPCHSVV